jgi:hypothetical protein
MKNTNLTVSQLRDAATSLRETMDDLASEIKGIEAELLTRFGQEGSKNIKARGQEHGETTFEVEDGIKVKYAITKTVSWDSDKLSEMASSIPDEIRERLFKVKITIPEKAWSIECESPIGRNLSIARSVKYSEPKISFA